MVMTYSRTQVSGRSYLMCAVCRRPLTKGYGVCYLVDEPGNSPPDPKSKQSLCGPHYTEQFVNTYGCQPDGVIDDNLLLAGSQVSLVEELGALTEFQRGSSVGALMGLDPALLEQALGAAKASAWGESVMSAYKRMKTEPDVEINVPITMAADTGQTGQPSSLAELQEKARNIQVLLDAALERAAKRDQIAQDAADLRLILADQLGCSVEDVDGVLKEKLG